MTRHTQSGALLAAMLLSSGCVLISGIDGFDTLDGKLTAAPGAEGSEGNGSVGSAGTDGGSSPATIASEKDSGTAPPVRPVAGVYSYDISGSDEIKGLFNFKSNYGPTAKVTVTYDGASCFSLVLGIRDGYDETMHLCIVGNEVVQDKGIRAQRFPIAGLVTTNLDCLPGDTYFGTVRKIGAKWDHSCKGGNSESQSGDSKFLTAGPYRFVGEETLAIKGANIPVVHFRDERVVSQAQTGTNVADWYFARDGSLMKVVRSTNIVYASFIGNVNYVENLTMTLNALPQ